MIDKEAFRARLARHARVEEVKDDDVLFGDGLNIGSLRFTEFIMEVEDEHGIDVDPDALDAGIRTVGQLHAAIDAIARESAS